MQQQQPHRASRYVLYAAPGDEICNVILSKIVWNANGVSIDGSVRHVNPLTMQTPLPRWLNGVPILADLTTKKIYKGTNCLKEMEDVYFHTPIAPQLIQGYGSYAPRDSAKEHFPAPAAATTAEQNFVLPPDPRDVLPSPLEAPNAPRALDAKPQPLFSDGDEVKSIHLPDSGVRRARKPTAAATPTQQKQFFIDTPATVVPRSILKTPRTATAAVDGSQEQIVPRTIVIDLPSLKTPASSVHTIAVPATQVAPVTLATPTFMSVTPSAQVAQVAQVAPVATAA